MPRKKKAFGQSVQGEGLYDLGFGLVDIETSDFATLAKGIGLDPEELAKFLSVEEKKSKLSAKDEKKD